MEKLATPDVTIADMIGDIDPIKAARRGQDISDELTVHYGLLPRANRGIFAINELPDLAGKIQVGLFNIMQEGDVQIKGYPVRLPLDLMLVFTANPEDYTARGKIITPLKDRIGSEIRTHYPADARAGHRHHRAGSLAGPRSSPIEVRVPVYITEIVEQLAFLAREDKRVDKRSGVSQRLPISVLENVVSNAERRALKNAGARGRAARAGYLLRAALHHRQDGAGIRRRVEGRRRGGARADPRGRGQGLRPLFRRRRTCRRSCSGSIWAASLEAGRDVGFGRRWCRQLGPIQGLMEKTEGAGAWRQRAGCGARLGRGVRAGGPVRAPAHQPQRRARLRRRRAQARSRARRGTAERPNLRRQYN